MVKKILFIENNVSFLVNAVTTNLSSNGFECFYAKPEIDSISEMEEAVSCLFLNLDADIAKNGGNLFVYLRDLYQNTQKKVFIMGENVDISDVRSRLGAEMVLDCFIRPINAKAITDRIIYAFDSELGEADKKHLLVVDDSGAFLHTAKEWLEPDYKVTILNSATSAIAYLGTNRPDLILLDYEMPICSGPMMLQMLRSDPNLSDIPVMFLTGNGDKASIQKVLSLKPQGYLLKSQNPDKILESISNFFEEEKRKQMLKSNGFI